MNAAYNHVQTRASHTMYAFIMSVIFACATVGLSPAASAQGSETTGPMQKSDSLRSVRTRDSLEAVSTFQPGGHELFFMPTAYTMPAGESYFEDYELFFLNFTTAVTNTTHIGVFTMFPLTTEFFESVTLGVKQNVYASKSISAAVFGSYSPRAPFGTIGGVLSVGSETTSGHIGYTGIIAEADLGVSDGGTGVQGNIIMLGFSHSLSSRTKIILEYENALAKGNDFNGLLTVGFRFSGKSLAWDIAAVRPLESTGSFLFLPYLKVIVML